MNPVVPGGDDEALFHHWQGSVANHDEVTVLASNLLPTVIHTTRPSIFQEILPVQGVAACLSTLILGGRRQSTDKDDTSSGSGSGTDKHARMFAGAALDLLMVLHARLPSSFKTTTSSTGGSSSSSLRAAAANRTAALSKQAAAAAAFEAVQEEGSTAASSGRSSSAGGAATASAGRGARCDGGCRRPQGAAPGLVAPDAWMMILRALSLGAGSKDLMVASHALQLLTKVCRVDEHLFYLTHFLVEECPALQCIRTSRYIFVMECAEASH